jgi:hypothetical protein
MIDKPQQRRSHSLNCCIRIQRLQVPYSDRYVVAVFERGFIGFARLKSAHDLADLVFGTVHETLLI